MNTVAHLGETRLSFDRLAWLLVCMVLVLLPHMMRMPAWISLLFVAMALWRLGAARMRWGMAPAWARAILAIIGMAAVGIQFRAWGGQEAGVAMLVVMMSLKLTEAVRKRDGLVLIFVGYVLVVGNFLYSQTLPTGAYMVLVTWCITATLLHLTHPTTGIPTRVRFRQAAVLLLQALPIAAILFLLFPRVPGPLWGVPAGQQSVSGLSDRMEPGSIAQLSLSEEVAFRVSFDGPAPNFRNLYWRGPVLRNFDGRVWQQGDEAAVETFSYTALDAATHYEVVLEPHRQRWLFALDLPSMVPDDAIITRTYQLMSTSPIRERRQYPMASHLVYRTGVETSEWEIRRALQLPAGGNPQARALAATLRQAHDDPRDAVVAMLQKLRTDPYYYTLSPPLLGQNSVDEFLFETRRGFCEHYAGSFAFVMRAAGIPARVVLGYHGGELNPVGNYLIVRQSDAHAWVEVYINNEGWVRVDPTGAVAPDRIESGMNSVEGLEGRPLRPLRDFRFLNQMRLRWDDVNNRWNLFVLGYDRQSQQALLEKFGIEDADYTTLVVVMMVLLMIVMTTLTLWLFWQVRPQHSRDPAVRLYRKLQQRLEKRGVGPRRPDEGPQDYAARVANSHPELEATVRRFIEAYVRMRYGAVPEQDDLTTMADAVRALR